MKIAAEPDPREWVVIPRFPSPGWARRTAIECANDWAPQIAHRKALEDLLTSLTQWTEPDALVRLFRVNSESKPSFIADITLVPADDDGSAEGRRQTQRQILRASIADEDLQSMSSYRPTDQTAGIIAVRADDPRKEYATPQVAIAVRMGTSLPTAPVDLVARFWGAPGSAILASLDEISAFIATVSPLRA